mgnify:CR=1 FL=1
MPTLADLQNQSLREIKKRELEKPPESPYLAKWKRAQLKAEVDHKLAQALDLAESAWKECCKDYEMEYGWPPGESKDGLPKQLVLLINVLRSIK